MNSSIALTGVPSSSSSSSSLDVFLSFRGVDTRNNFTSHLYSALCQKGINTYIDDELRRGEEISPALFKGIEESKISIIVFSENYTSSKWCLEELLKILECKESKQQKVLPIFYKVEPSTLRHQKNSFEELLTKHKDKDDAKIQRWKAALKQVADLSGWHLGINENESEFIKKIVQEVSRILNRTYLHVADCPVGIESRVKEINMLLRTEMINETRMIGIFGTGGIGKTTIAKEVYNRIADQFEGTCFLENVRETSRDLTQLQEKMLNEILGDSSLKVSLVDRGIILIKERLCHKKILLILDDVDHSNQLEKLCGSCDWFGLGSRIIITTRDEHLLVKHDVGWRYSMTELDRDDCLKLFAWHAFKCDKPYDGFVELTKLALQYASGLPLALKVVGSNLRGRDKRYWKSELEKYKRIPEKDIQETLKISFDGLDYFEQNILLDIGCFFKGLHREHVRKIMDSCGFWTDAGFGRLVDKCLITINEDDRLIRMHDLVQDMCKEIVRKESPKEPGKRSRLWFHEDVRSVLEENTGTGKIEGIVIDLPLDQVNRVIHLDPKAFSNMKQLRIFINRNASFISSGSDELNYLSNELRVLEWPKYPFQSLPSNFHGEKLHELRMDRSMITNIGVGLLSEHLTNMSFRECEYLTKISNLSRCSNLRGLILDKCKSLVEVDDSVGFLDELTVLSFYDCSSLKKLPRIFKLRSLKLLELGGCRSLENFPEIQCKMEQLKFFCLQSTVIQELSSSITYLTRLNRLFMNGCKSFVHLPVNIFQLEHLEDVDIVNCPNFVNFGKEVEHNRQSMPCNGSTRVNKISSNLFKTLNFSSSLRNLNLSGSGIVSLPPCIEGFVGLYHLNLQDCKQLEEILQLPPHIEEVNVAGCTSLKSFPHVSAESSLPYSNRLRWIDLSDCNKIDVNVGNYAPNPLLVQERFRMKTSSIIIYPGSRFPEWFKHRKETSYSNCCKIDINNALLGENEIVALVFCFVAGTIPVPFESITVSISGKPIRLGMRLPPSMGPNHVWLQYMAATSIEIQPMHRDGNNLRFTFESHSEGAAIFFKSIGVHLIYKNEDFIDRIQPSKRYRDDDNHDLESEWNPQQKRPSSTLCIVDLD